jgi:hypothetical protein
LPDLSHRTRMVRQGCLGVRELGCVSARTAARALADSWTATGTIRAIREWQGTSGRQDKRCATGSGAPGGFCRGEGGRRPAPARPTGAAASRKETRQVPICSGRRSRFVSVMHGGWPATAWLRHTGRQSVRSGGRP